MLAILTRTCLRYSTRVIRESSLATTIIKKLVAMQMIWAKNLSCLTWMKKGRTKRDSLMNSGKKCPTNLRMPQRNKVKTRNSRRSFLGNERICRKRHGLATSSNRSNLCQIGSAKSCNLSRIAPATREKRRRC